MTLAELKEKVGTFPIKNFTIAGVPSIHSRLMPEFYDDKLDNLFFFFKSDSFYQVHGAIMKKYPKLACENSTVTNRMGASFTQVKCSLSDKLGTLRLNLFSSDIDTSVLSLTSDRLVKEHRDKAKANNNDL